MTDLCRPGLIVTSDAVQHIYDMLSIISVIKKHCFARDTFTFQSFQLQIRI
jgi:hypothetical protein